jgi:hypothetical protein
MGEMRNVHKISAHLGDIDINGRIILTRSGILVDGLDSYGLELGPVAGFYEQGNESTVFLKTADFLTI